MEKLLANYLEAYVDIIVEQGTRYDFLPQTPRNYEMILKANEDFGEKEIITQNGYYLVDKVILASYLEKLLRNGELKFQS